MEQHPSYKKPLTLALVLAGVSSVVYWFEYSKKPADEVSKSSERKVFALKEPSVRTLRLMREGQAVVLECTNPKGECKQSANTQWVLQEPLKARGDSSNVQSLLTNLLGMGGTDSVSLKEESPETRQSLLKSYRLDAESRSSPAARKVSLTTDDGKTITAWLGELATTTNSHYALAERDGAVNEEIVYLVPKHQVAALEQPITHWRDKRIVALSQSEVTSFELTSSVGKVNAVKSPEGWQIVEGSEKVAADPDAVDTFLSGVVFLNAKNFTAEKKDSPEGKAAMKGLKQEALLSLKAGERTVTLRLHSKNFRDGKKTAAIAFATVDDLDPVFEVDTSSLDRVKKKAADFRMKKLIAVNERGDVRWARFTFPGKKSNTVTLKLEGSEWKRTGEGKPVVNTSVNTFLDRISGPTVDNFLLNQSSPAGAVLVELGPSESELRHRFQFWRSGKRALAKNLSSSRNEVLSLVEPASADIPWDEASLTTARDAPAPAPAPEPDAHDDHHGHAH